MILDGAWCSWCRSEPWAPQMSCEEYACDNTGLTLHPNIILLTHHTRSCLMLISVCSLRNAMMLCRNITVKYCNGRSGPDHLLSECLFYSQTATFIKSVRLKRICGEGVWCTSTTRRRNCSTQRMADRCCLQWAVNALTFLIKRCGAKCGGLISPLFDSTSFFVTHCKYSTRTRHYN